MPAESPENEYVSLRTILRTIRQRLWVVVVAATIFVAVAVGASLLQTPQYEASLEILVGQRQAASEPYSLGSDVQGLQQLTLTLARAASSRSLAEAVIERSNLSMTPEEFQEERLDVEPITDTQFIEVSYRDTDPEQARRVANVVGEVFSSRVSEVSGDASGITATVWDPAVRPDEPISPDPLRNGLLGLVAGTLAGLLLVYLLDYLDDSWRSPEEVERASGVPTFGVVPNFDGVKSTILKSQRKGKD